MIGKLVFLSLVIGGAAWGGAGSLEPDQKQRPIARREPLERSEVLLGARGEMVQSKETAQVDPTEEFTGKCTGGVARASVEASNLADCEAQAKFLQPHMQIHHFDYNGEGGGDEPCHSRTLRSQLCPCTLYKGDSTQGAVVAEDNGFKCYKLAAEPMVNISTVAVGQSTQAQATNSDCAAGFCGHLSAPALGERKACNMDFPEGKPWTSATEQARCGNTVHSIIVDNGICAFAAAINGVPAAPWQTFIIDHLNFPKHPRGCVKLPCHNATTDECYFYNDNGDADAQQNADTTGTPVCIRDRWAYGTVDSDTCLSSDSTSDVSNVVETKYKAIANSAECSRAAACLETMVGDPLKVSDDTSNFHQYKYYPVGCFKNDETDKAYYNEAQTDTSGNIIRGDPADIAGRIICTLE